jgi:uncharacterized membrane protein YjgN (DUF898 family)
MKGGKKVGPMDGAKLKKLADSGQISPSDMVWKDGFPDWKPASSVKGLFGAQVKTAPAAAPAREAEEEDDDRDRRRPSRRGGRDSAVAPTGQGFEFLGTGGSFFSVALVAYLLATFTCGIGYPWAICNVLKWKAENTYIDGRRLRFDGTGGSLFGLFLKVYFLGMLTCGIYYIWGIPEILKWVTENTLFDDA